MAFLSSITGGSGRLFTQSVDKVIQRLLDSDIDLTELALQNQGMTAETCGRLCKVLKGPPISWVTTIHLAKNAFGDEGLAHITEVVAKSKNLTDLDVSSTNISDEGVRSLLAVLATSPLRHLNLSNNRIIACEPFAALLKQSPLLTSLSLDGNRLSLHGDQGPLSLVSSLTSNTSLTELGLSNASISEAVATAISSLLFESNHTLVSIRLKHNSIPKSVLMTIEAALEKNRADAATAGNTRPSPEPVVHSPSQASSVSGDDVVERAAKVMAAASSSSSKIGDGLQQSRMIEQLKYDVGKVTEEKKKLEAELAVLNNRLVDLDEQLRGERDQVVSLRKLLGEETATNRQLNEDLVRSSQALMTKIEVITERHSNQSAVWQREIVELQRALEDERRKQGPSQLLQQIERERRRAQQLESKLTRTTSDISTQTVPVPVTMPMPTSSPSHTASTPVGNESMCSTVSGTLQEERRTEGDNLESTTTTTVKYDGKRKIVTKRIVRKRKEVKHEEGSDGEDDSEAQQAQASLAAAEEEKKKLEEIIAKHHEEIARLKAVCEETELEAGTIAGELAETKADRDRLAEEMAAVKAEKDEAIRAAESEGQRVSDELTAAKESLEGLKKEVAALREQLTASKAASEAVSMDLAAAQKEAEEVEAKAGTLEEEVARVRGELDTMKKMKAELSDKLEKATKEKEEITRAHEKLLEESGKLQRMAGEWREKAESAEHRAAETEEARGQLQEAVDNLNSRSKLLLARAVEAEAELEKSKQEIQSLQGDELVVKTLQLEREVQSLTIDHDEQAATIEKLEGEVEMWKQRVEEEKSRVVGSADANEELQQLRMDLQAMREKGSDAVVASYKAETQKAKDELEAACAEMIGLQASLQREEIEKQSLRKKYEALDKEKKKGVKALETLQAKHTSLEELHAERGNTISELERKITEYADKSAELTMSLDAAQGKITQLEEEVVALRESSVKPEEHEGLKKVISDLTAALEAKAEEASSLLSQLHEQEAAAAQQRADVTVQLAELQVSANKSTEMQKRVDELERKLQSTEEALKASQSALQAKAKEAEEAVLRAKDVHSDSMRKMELESLVAKLEEQLQNETTRAEGAKEALLEMNDRMAKFESEKAAGSAEAMETVRELEEKIETLQKEKEMLDREAADARGLREQMAALQSEKDELAAAKEEVERELHEFVLEQQDKGKEETEKAQELEKELQEANERLQKHERTNNELNSELETLRSELAELRAAELRRIDDIREMRLARKECDEELASLRNKLREQSERFDTCQTEYEDRIAELECRLEAILVTDGAMRRAEAERQEWASNISRDDEDTLPEGVSKKDWEDSKHVKECTKCSKRFGLRLRKHHCRFCGKVFCDTCCSKSKLAGGVRVCIDCNQAQVNVNTGKRQ